METLEAASRARQWATLGMSVNNAQYTLLRLLKKKELDDAARDYAKKGIELLNLLDAAVPTPQSGQISWGRQLAAVAAMEPITRINPQKAIEPGQINQVLQLFQEIDNKNLGNCSEQRLTAALDILQRWSDAYAAAGFAELQERRRTYDRPFAVKSLV
jgi:hypothetical protein